jgi:ERCC4-type nuclease
MMASGRNRELDKFQRDALIATADQSARRKPAAAKPLATLHVLVDTREQSAWKFSEACTVERCTLSEGDYSIAGYTDRVRVERKSLADLVGSLTIGRERFLAECERLMPYPFKALVIEATIEDVITHSYRSQAYPNSVIGSVKSLFGDYGLPVYWKSNAMIAAQWCEWAFRRFASKWEPSGD